MTSRESPQRFVAKPPAAVAQQRQLAAQARHGGLETLAQALQSQIPYGARAAIHELLSNPRFDQGE